MYLFYVNKTHLLQITSILKLNLFYQVEDLQSELVKLREELLGAMGQLEDERHRARTLQRMVTSSTTREERETVIRSLEENRELSSSSDNSTDQ